MKSRFLLVAITVLSLSGCAKNLPAAMFMPKNINTAEQAITDSALGDVTVTAATEGVEQHITPENFKIALVQTLKRANIFGADHLKATKIDAHIIGATFPAAGFSMTSDLNVHYKITTTDGQILFDEDVIYQGKATVGDEFFGSSRALLAFQRANEGHFNLLIPKIKDAVSHIDN